MRSLLVLMTLLMALPALAQDNPFYPVQGVLTTAAGDAVEGSQAVTFSLYVTDTDANAVWTETQTLTFTAGLFTAYLGDVNDLDVDLFATNDGLWLGIEIGSDGEMERVFLGASPYAGYAARAGSVDASALPSDVVLGGQDCPTDTVAIGLTADGDLLCDGIPGWDQACTAGDVVTGIDVNGNLVCDAAATYDGTDFALAGTQCISGYVMTGVSASGLPSCTEPEVSAAANQICTAGAVVTGVDAAGALVCEPVEVGVATDQACGPGDVVVGLDAAGALVCEPQAVVDTIDGLSGGTVDGATTVDGDLSVTGSLDVTGNLSVSGTLQVGGEWLGYEDQPLVLFGHEPGFCTNTGTNVGWVNYPRAFDAEPSFVAGMDESINDNGASWIRTDRSYPNRAGVRCNSILDGLPWMAVDQGNWTVDGKAIESRVHRPASGVANGSAIFFNQAFQQAPVVLAMIDETTNQNGPTSIRLINTIGPSGFEVRLYSTTADGVAYVAMDPGEYTYGRYHWLAGVFAVNNACSPSTADCQFDLPVGMFNNAVNGIFLVHDDNDSGGASYARARRLEPELVSLRLPANTEFVHYVVWEEL